MDKSCANHPESMALATCKACEKSVCLMCVVDEKEGTFCSAECHSAFVNGKEVPKFVGAGAKSSSSGGGVQKLDSIFDDESAAPAPSSEGLPVPPSEEPMPIVSEGTKWRPIGAQCENHTDTPAVANCDRCGRPVCALCLLEASQGTFCSAECMGASAKQPATAPAPAERAALQGKPVFKFKAPPKSNKGPIAAAVIVLLIAAVAGGYYAWNGFSSTSPGQITRNPELPPENPPTPEVPKPDTIKPDVVKPDVVKPDTAKPDVVKPDTVKPPQPDIAKPPTPPETYEVRPKIKPPPKPVVLPVRVLNPWDDKEPGVWYRMRTVRGGEVTQTDTGLKEKGKNTYVLVSQTYANGQAGPVTEDRIQAPTVFLHGEESFTFDGQQYLCEIRSPGPEGTSPKTWALLSGANMGAVVKLVSPEVTITPTRVWPHTLRVKGRALDCVVVETQVHGGASTRSVKSWYCGSIPLGLIRRESGSESTALVDLGFDWGKRPPFEK